MRIIDTPLSKVDQVLYDATIQYLRRPDLDHGIDEDSLPSIRSVRTLMQKFSATSIVTDAKRRNGSQKMPMKDKYREILSQDKMSLRKVLPVLESKGIKISRGGLHKVARRAGMWA